MIIMLLLLLFSFWFWFYSKSHIVRCDFHYLPLHSTSESSCGFESRLICIIWINELEEHTWCNIHTSVQCSWTIEEWDEKWSAGAKQTQYMCVSMGKNEGICFVMMMHCISMLRANINNAEATENREKSRWILELNNIKLESVSIAACYHSSRFFSLSFLHGEAIVIDLITD